MHARGMDKASREQEQYYELSYYTLAHSAPAFIHQHIVDAYSAQTADGNTKSITLAFALVGLYLHLIKDCSGKQVQQAHMQLAKRKRQWPAFGLPKCRGEIRVSDVVAVPAGEERDAMICRWCASVWETYSESHEDVASIVRTGLK